MARPQSEITDDVLEAAKTLAAQGLTKEQIADLMANKQFLQAIADGEVQALCDITNVLCQVAIGGNVDALIFYLESRDPDNWKGKQNLEIHDRTTTH